MSNSAVSVENVWKYFRLYHEKNQYLKSTLLRGRRARYDEFWALKGVDFEIPFGSTFGIIGSNGSGKSTLLKCLAGILSPDKGSVSCNGRMAALLELGAGFHPDLSGRENIYLNGAILGMTRSEIDRKLEEIIDFSGLEKFVDTPVKNYSSGMVVRLGFAVATNVDPEILIIDEVLAVGDESFQHRCHEKIESFRQEGRTIILVSHGLMQVAQLCSTVAWLEKGVIQEIGPSYEVIGKYAGQSHDAAPKVEGEIGERWGSHEAEITRAEFVTADGVPVHVLKTGEPISLQIDYTAHMPIKEPVFGIRITHLHGTNVWGSNTKRMGFQPATLNNSGTITLNIPELPILAGTYDLTVALTDQHETYEYDHWERRVRFDVVQYNSFDEGLIQINANWFS
jgi:ABC-type polysaccharide/polyol phosphate transport system ATPase subunit